MKAWIANEWKRLVPYFSLLDFGAAPTTRVGWLVRATVVVFAGLVLFLRARTLTAPLLRSKPPIPIPSEEIADWRFRLPEHTRREIFAQIAEYELQQRGTAIATSSWNGHLWSREDDRGHYERMFMRTVAKRYNISLSQAYLVLDEGVHLKWPAPDGEPLPATAPPLNPRQTW